jgi:hypothetical protein
VRHRVGCLLVVCAATSGCRSSRAIAAEPSCVRETAPAWSPDSSFAICLPASFVSASGSEKDRHILWARGDVQSPSRAWLSISVDAEPKPDGAWPPHLVTTASCLADCTTADSVMEHRDTLSTGVVTVETGLVTGGYLGFRRQPVLVAGWVLPSGARVWATGFVTRAAALDTLREALRTLQFRRE